MRFLDSVKISHKVLLVAVSALVACIAFSAATVSLGKGQIRNLEEIYNKKVIPLDNLRKVQLIFRELEYRMAGVWPSFFYINRNAFSRHLGADLDTSRPSNAQKDALFGCHRNLIPP